MNDNENKPPRNYGIRAAWHLFGFVAALALGIGSAWIGEALQKPGSCEGWCFAKRLFLTVAGFAGAARYCGWYVCR